MKNLNCIPLVLTLSLAAGCGSTGGQRPDAPGPVTTTEEPAEPELTAAETEARAAALLAPEPWTDAFQSTAMLLADRIRIEGPVGLLEHVAVRSDDAIFLRTSETTSEGFLQRTVPRANTKGSTDQTYLVRGQLDGWQLTAYTEVVVLERPGDVPVTVIAQGNAVWKDRDGAEQRQNRLVFSGEIGQVATPDTASSERE